MPIVTERLSNRPVWFDLATSDLTAAKALYADVFGWTFGDSPAELGFYTMAFAQGIPAAAIAPTSASRSRCTAPLRGRPPRR